MGKLWVKNQGFDKLGINVKDMGNLAIGQELRENKSCSRLEESTDCEGVQKTLNLREYGYYIHAFI